MTADHHVPDVEVRGVTVYIDGAPGPHLAGPLATRPQDWAPRARAILFTEAQIARAAARTNR